MVTPATSAVGQDVPQFEGPLKGRKWQGGTQNGILQLPSCLTLDREVWFQNIFFIIFLCSFFRSILCLLLYFSPSPFSFFFVFLFFLSFSKPGRMLKRCLTLKHNCTDISNHNTSFCCIHTSCQPWIKHWHTEATLKPNIYHLNSNCHAPFIVVYFFCPVIAHYQNTCSCKQNLSFPLSACTSPLIHELCQRLTLVTSLRFLSRELQEAWTNQDQTPSRSRRIDLV